MEDSSELCVICGKDDDDPINNVGPKGLKNLKKACLEKGEEELERRLNELSEASSKIVVHVNCRKRFIDQRSVKSPIPVKKLRSSVQLFNWKQDCFLCEKSCDIRRGKFREAMTLSLRESLLARAHERNDEWGNKIVARMETCADLVAEEAVYHPGCMVDFRLNFESQRSHAGRPADTQMSEAFEKFCNYFENAMDCEIYSVADLHKEMLKFNENGYSLKSFRQKLKSRYKEHIYFVKGEGRHSELVCFRNMTDFIIREMKNKTSTKASVLTAAAKIIKAEIRELKATKTAYPNEGDTADIAKGNKWVPESLKVFMKQLVASEVKCLSISQCVVQAARPRSVIMPIPFGLGVQVEKTIDSKWLVNHLSKLGFSITPDEVLRFKQSAIENMEASYGAEEQDSTESENSKFVQWVADNVDHNTATLSGKNTFHGMGIICTSNKPLKGHFGSVPRLRERRKAADFIDKKGVEIVSYYKSSTIGLKKLVLAPFRQLKAVLTIPVEVNYDFIWHCTWFCKIDNYTRPNWSGFMQYATSTSQETKCKSNIQFLPIIDLDPGSETCIYSTLMFVIGQAKKIGVTTPSVTFDQPLWLKAMGIIEEERLQIVCRLGGFHTLMSFLGSLGKLMAGSGLEDLLAEVYAENSIPHILSGKAIARSLRAHLSVQSALMSLLIQKAKDEENTSEFDTIESFLPSLLDIAPNNELFETLATSLEFQNTTRKIEELKTNLSHQSRTAQLWLLYMDYVNVAKMFIFAERTSNWELHLFTVEQMLNLFASTGHVHYAKSARLYVQQMKNLNVSHPWLYQQFLEEQHTVKRTAKNFTGLWTDLVIEQTLMRTIKSKGGLTEGRGMTESVRNLWVLSLSHSASIHDAMMQLSKSQIKSSEQHVELGNSRRKRDYNDCQKFLSWLELKNPFLVPNLNLLSLSKGVVSIQGKDNVDCEQAEKIGERIQRSLDGVPITNATIKRKDLLKPLDVLLEVRKKKSDLKGIDSNTIFNRMIAVAEREDSIERFFEYELTSEPMSLFKDGLMRKPDKPSLRKAVLPDSSSHSLESIDKQVTSIVDGGALLHKVRWKKDTKFSEIGRSYVKYIKNHYNFAVVVFDGYENRSNTKCQEHLRRNSIPQSTFVKIDPENAIPFTQDRYLSNIENKAEFIRFISGLFKMSDIEVHNSLGDADTLIVQEALRYASRRNGIVNVIADDTDIVIMLLHHWKPDIHDDIYFVQERFDKAWSMNEASQSIEDIKEDLLFIHAWSGCDTTSSIFGKGKGNLITSLRKSPEMQGKSAIISNIWSSQNEVGEASVAAFKILYGGNANSSLVKLRYDRYMSLAAKGVIAPEKLPPSERAAYFHGLRTHYQIMCWSLLNEEFLFDAKQWGWKIDSSNGQLLPIMTDLPIAPEVLTKVVRCNCKSNTKNQCGTNVCTCHKFGMACVSSCGECHGIECNNSDDHMIVQDENSDHSDTEFVNRKEGHEEFSDNDSNIFDVFDVC